MFKYVLFVSCLFLFSTCVYDTQLLNSTSYDLQLPEGFPMPKVPENNRLTNERVALGKKLFYDVGLSIDSTVACVSCHKQEFAFADNRALSLGVKGRLGFRNAPSLANAAYLGRVHKDGGVPHIDFQPLVPIEDEQEMDINLLALAKRLNADPNYAQLFLTAYHDEATPFTITRAIASFVRTLISGNSKYDQVKHGKARFTESEARGKALFFSSRTKCSSCHSSFNFDKEAYENNGLKMDYSKDTGRQRISLDKADQGKFRIPSLRNVELTKPYMHDGSLQTLEEVVEHYDKGGQPHPNKSLLIRALNLSKQEKTDLIDFLKTLTDDSFIQNPAYQPDLE